MSMDWQTESNMAEMQLMKTKQAMKNMPVKMQTRPVETWPNEMCRAPAGGWAAAAEVWRWAAAFLG